MGVLWLRTLDTGIRQVHFSSMTYVIYVNRIHRSARVHKASCGYLRMHGGVSSRVPPTGYYEEGISSLDEAIQIAQRTGHTVFNCKVCL